MDFKKLQETLNRSKKMAKDLDEKFEYYERQEKKMTLDIHYKNLCNQFSPAYLTGSSWYVGESLIDANIPFSKFLSTIECINKYKF